MSTPGVGIQILSPTGTGPQGGPEQVIFTTKYPFAKLDTQLGVDLKTDPPKGPVSFQNISIFFNTNPPVVVHVETRTLVYQFAHGYNYIPTYWVLFRNDNASNDSAQQTYGNEGSTVLSTGPASFTQFLVKVDATNFSIYISQNWDGVDTEPNIVGFTLKFRVYIFTDPVLLS